MKLSSTTTGRADPIPPAVQPPFILPLEEAHRHPIERVGAKAAHLSEAMGLGHRVPSGVVIPVDALAGGITEGLVDQVVDSAARLTPGPVAVRSSGVAEDGAEQSFAGQFVTRLGVVGRDAIRDAMRACLESAASASMVAYGHREIQPLAILIQRQVSATLSGVAFSADPVTGARDEVVIDAVSGLGDRLVNGEATPDSWVVRGSEATRRGGGEPVLDPVRAMEVAALVRRLESELGGPRDIEWAYEGETLFLLQVRPITALPPEPIPVPFDPPPGSWQRNDHHTTLSPMGYGLFCEVYDQGQTEAFRKYGVPVKEVRSARIGDHLYLKFEMEGGGEGTPPDFVLWLLSRLAPSMRRMNKRAQEIFGGRVHHREMIEWEEERKPWFQERIAEIDPKEALRMDDSALLERWSQVVSLMHDGVRAHADTMGNWIAIGEFCVFCRAHLGWDHATCMAAMAGWSRATTQVRDSLATLCRTHLTPASARELLALAQDGPMDAALPPGLARDLEEWRAANALRMQDYDLVNPTLSETPERIDHALRIALEGLAEERSDPRERVDAARERLHAEAQRTLAGTPLATEFEELASWARRAYGYRDENGFWTISSLFGLARLHLLEIGRRLPELDVPEHVFYLEPAEVGPAMQGTLPGYGERVARRRGEEQWARFHRGPARIGPPEPPMPPTRAFPPPLRKLFDILAWSMDVEMDGASGGRVDDRSLEGRGASGGRYTGPARRVRGPADFERVQPGDVVVCRITSPEWCILFDRVGGLITEEGGFLSHPAIIAREFGIPAVVGIEDAIAAVSDGALVTVDGDTGRVTLEESPETP